MTASAAVMRWRSMIFLDSDQIEEKQRLKRRILRAFERRTGNSPAFCGAYNDCIWAQSGRTARGPIPVIMTKRVRRSLLRQLLGERHHLLNDDNWAQSGHLSQCLNKASPRDGALFSQLSRNDDSKYSNNLNFCLSSA